MYVYTRNCYVIRSDVRFSSEMGWWSPLDESDGAADSRDILSTWNLLATGPKKDVHRDSETISQSEVKTDTAAVVTTWKCVM